MALERRRRPRLPDLDDLRRGARAARQRPSSPRPTSRCSPPRPTTRACACRRTKAGLIAGMSMTEKQGGSDVRANTTQAVPQPDGSYRLTGHKWFTSAPMCDLFLALAQAPGGLSCFLVPRVLPDGSRNAMHLMRLKDKLGNKSNASSEIEYDGATAWLVGEEGRGVRTIVEMVNMTRLDCTLGTAAGMRTAPCRPPTTPGTAAPSARRLVDQPLMRNVLADLVVESEAATTVAMRLAGATDRAVARRPRRRRPSAGWRSRSASTGSASAARPWPARRWSASAATATWRSPACRASTASCRCSRSGRAPATSRPSTRCARWPASRSRSSSSSPRSSSPPAPTTGSTTRSPR